MVYPVRRKNCPCRSGLAGAGRDGLARDLPGAGSDQMQTLTANLAVNKSLVVCQNHQGMEIRASLSRLTRYLAVIEVYNPDLVVRLSEVLSPFQVIFQDRVVYHGRAVVRNLVSTGLTLVCEVALEAGSWAEEEFTPATLADGRLREQFGRFIGEWQKVCKVAPDYKLIIADVQTFLMDLRQWLDQVQLGIGSAAEGDRVLMEQAAQEAVAEPVSACVNALLEKFEAVAGGLEEELKPAHRSYMRRQLHPWVLCSPFAYRAFAKPLGYAGDYAMVNMMARNTPDGASLFAKAVDTFFLRQAPAEAHRNRLEYLGRHLLAETARVAGTGREARVQDVACGPAVEIQQFLREQPLSARAHFTLLDFNEETLKHAQAALTGIRSGGGRSSGLQFVKKSVHSILKESVRRTKRRAEEQYDLVYCGGLFDYLSDQVCRQLMEEMYDWLAPGGLLIATNVEPSNPMRHWMEHLLDWHLVYRTGAELRALKPAAADPDSVFVQGDDTGVNVFLEVRKPRHA
jgi:extracellular factor (EF) 3-hydroxypalmitic acid methyl ester biosynthesis protein